ncbi:MAG: DUF2244 domain-containing protein [Beijerinckiaceae bacterium]|nr:DUF2244 domain-containing protein [Beijerinckiaceae bacterium]
MSDNDPWNAQIFAARISPHRSLNQQNFRVLLMVFCGACFLTSLPFVLLGAWPIAGFMGLDVLIFWLAFRANFRAARAYEDVSVTPLELKLAKVSPRGERAEWIWNPLWVRLVRKEDEDYGLERVTLVSRDREVEVAGFLGPDARAEFAGRLSSALAEAKRGPRFS